jgi:hypothetical protein
MNVKPIQKSSPSYEYRLHIRMSVPSQANQRICWQAKSRLASKQRRHVHTMLLLTFGRIRATSKPTVTLIRIGRELDSDNLPASLKNIRDGVADWLQIRVDAKGRGSDSDRLIEWKYYQRPGTPQGVKIIVALAGEKGK